MAETCIRLCVLGHFAETSPKTIEAAFKEFTSREDIAIVLISQNVAGQIRSAISHHTKVIQRSLYHVGDDCTAQGRYGDQTCSANAFMQCDNVLPTHPKCAMLVVFVQAVPSVLEIPSKDHPYEPAQDSLLTRVKHIMGAS
jgi:V-type H+-transporting ATPase subunit F